ncbi:MAG: hypothetical protein J2O49_02065 [Sciscionella sp.]|nr:hypothetical protein [Sciscionella sp.]
MSADYTILVRANPGVTDDDLLRDANRMVGSVFQLYTDHHPHCTDYKEYSTLTEFGTLVLDIHDDIGDEIDYPIGAYRYDFMVDTPGMGQPGVPEESARRMRFMRKLYDGLVETGRYTCMFVWNGARVLATNVPGFEVSGRSASGIDAAQSSKGAPATKPPADDDEDYSGYTWTE